LNLAKIEEIAQNGQSQTLAFEINGSIM